MKNSLPYDGTTLYHGELLTDKEEKRYFTALLQHIPWQQDEVIIFGRTIITKRKVAWYGDKPFAYTYSHKTKEALYWTKELLELKTRVEKITQNRFNSCLLNLYHDGSEGMGWHSDDEKSIEPESPIASLSLGAGRKFLFKHKTSKETVPLFLESGSLLLMEGATQRCWLHSLPKTTKVHTPRINLTFRTMLEQGK